MANSKNVSNSEPVDAKTVEEAQLWERFTKIQTDRYMYNPNQGCEGPLVGYLVNKIPMPPIGKRDWDAFLIITTEPANVIDREKDIVLVEPGSEVLIPATYQLSQKLSNASQNPKTVYEVIIQPTKKIDIDNNQTMWLYNMGANMKAPKTRKEFGPVGILGSQALNAAKPEEPSDADEDAVPFG